MNRKMILRIGTALLAGLLCFFIQSTAGVVYTETDNFTAAMIINGLFGDNPYCQIQHPFFCRSLYVLAQLIPQCDVFGSVIQVFITIAFILVVYIVCEDFISGLIALLFALFLTINVRIYSVNLLTQAAFFSFTGALLLYLRKRIQKTWLPVLLGTIYLCLGFMLRRESMLICIPFIILMCLAQIMDSDDKKKTALRTGISLVPLFLLLIILDTTKKDFYRQESYLQAVQYNSARGLVEDYPMADYSSLLNTTGGFTETEYRAAVMWMLADTDTLTTEKLRAIGRAGSSINTSLKSSRIKSTVKEMWEFLSGQGMVLSIFVIVSLLMIILILLSKTSLIYRIAAVCAFVGAVIILFYFTLRGRAPLRVWQAAFFATLAVLFSLPFTNDLKTRIVSIAVCIVLGVAVLDSGLTIEFHRFMTPFNGRSGADESIFADTFRDDIVCVWGGFSGKEAEDGYHVDNYLGGWYNNVSEHFIYQCKLPSKEFLRHNIPIGEWIYGQVYFNQHLDSIGMKNPAKEMLDRNDVFFVNGNGKQVYLDFLNEYMTEHFGEISFVEAGAIGENPVYKLVKSD